MQFPGFILTGGGQALLAKVAAGATLTLTKAATGAGQMPPGDAPFAAVADGDTVTVTRTENGAATASDVDTGFTITEETSGGSGTAEVTSVQCLAGSALSGGEYFTVGSPYVDFHVWFTVDGVGVEPSVADSVGIQVDIEALDSALTVAATLATALDQFRLDLTHLYGLLDQRQELAITSVTRVDDVVTEVATVLSNSGLAAGYYLCELGIFADDPDDGEILYAVTNAGGQGDYFPAEGGATVIETDLVMRTTISADAALSMAVATGAYASLQMVVDDQQQRAHKAPVRAATTEDITLSGEQTVDGVALVANDRVLVKDQATGAENGIYLVAAGDWSRTADADEAVKLAPGALVPVAEGTIGADAVWQLATDADIDLGVTALVFVPVGKYHIDTGDGTGYRLFIQNGVLMMAEV